ncbi:nucleotidyltransferase domain-containing protein [Glaciibacter flavus]|uniref:Nucleotidyltransferase domain-containing protein n=1 Tax=Orlajensenia flava TaxID=2565934 RepID=A0A4S4FW82_9MICO|nr:nucleotidyltransferase domain-containing protein [Glaciibacter flavus]THG34332.1 nucleotidyltransferase domain-containing protein [Glaciibacter flavus]
MDLSHPEYAVLGEDRARILRRLFVLAEPASGRRIHQLSGVTSLRTTQRILDELVRTGMVEVQRLGSAFAYQANRDHVLWGPVEQVLAVPSLAEQQMAEILTETLGDKTTSTALYGSFARGDAREDSDVDILVVWNDHVAAGQKEDTLHAAAEAIRRLTGNETQLFAVSPAELNRLIENDAPLIESLRTDARRLTGIELKRLLKSGRA